MIEQGLAHTYRPAQRTPYRLFNTLVSLIDRLRSQPTFVATPKDVLRAASKITGVGDFDCPEFGEPLQMFCDETTNPRLSAFGRLGVKQGVISRVVNRLNIEKALRADPDIVNESLKKPWFVMGLPRSGTTLLQRLLAQDPNHRALKFWEGITPFPRNARDTVQRRMAAAKFFVRATNYMAPDLKAKHEIGADLPEECRLLLAQSLVCTTMWGASEKFNEWYSKVDRTRAFQLHKIQLQYLQRHCPKRTWVLKDPEHLSNLDYLLKTYPDACIVKLHRDPVEVLPSTASLQTTLEGISVREVDTHEIGRNVFEDAKATCYSRFNTRSGSDELAARGVLFIDVRYIDLMADPIATVAGIYKRFGTEFTNDAKTAMQIYLRNNPQKKHGAHRYSLEEFGLDPNIIQKEFADYVDRYITNPSN